MNDQHDDGYDYIDLDDTEHYATWGLKEADYAAARERLEDEKRAAQLPTTKP